MTNELIALILQRIIRRLINISTLYINRLVLPNGRLGASVWRLGMILFLFLIATATLRAQNTAPTFTSSAVTSVADDELYDYMISTSDVDGDRMTLSAVTLPAWLSLSTEDMVSTVAVQGVFRPNGIVVDSEGTAYFSDYVSIKKITSDGLVSILAGSSGFEIGYAEGQGTDARFGDLGELVLDVFGNLYVADLGNNRIRKITPSGLVSTFAGSGQSGAQDGPAATASFHQPRGLAIDHDGNLYVGDEGNKKIRKITPGGEVSTFAGSGLQGSVDGQGILAQFVSPRSLAIDSESNIYVADQYRYKIRKITPAGLVSTHSGSGSWGDTDGSAGTASFNSLYGIVADGYGNIFVADGYSQKIRQVTPSGEVFTLAGTGIEGDQDGTATTATFTVPLSIATDGLGNIYIGEHDGIRKIATDDKLTGDPTNEEGLYPVVLNVVDGQGGSTDQSFSVTVDVVQPTHKTLYPIDGATEVNTFLDFSMTFSKSMTLGSGSIYLIASSDSSLVSSLPVSSLSIDQENVYGSFGLVPKFTQYSMIVTDSALQDTFGMSFAGFLTKDLWSFRTGDFTSPEVTSIVRFNPVEELITVEPDTLIFRVSFSEGIIGFDINDLVIKPGGASGTIHSIDTIADRAIFDVKVTDLAGTGIIDIDFKPSTGIVDSVGNAFVGDIIFEQSYIIENGVPVFTSIPVTTVEDIQSYHYTIEVTDVDGTPLTLTAPTLPSWLDFSAGDVVSTVAGDQSLFGNENGPISEASFLAPGAMTIDAQGNIYVSDRNANIIRKISVDGFVTTLAGSSYGYLDGPGATAQFRSPSGLGVDADGNVYVADQVNRRIRKITPTGAVSTLAGTGEHGTSDGAGDVATFRSPIDLAVDDDGNVYVVDTYSYKIRKITPAGVVSTLAGDGQIGSTDGPGASARFNVPIAIDVDQHGNIYVGESAGHKIRKITPSGFVSTLSGSGQAADGLNYIDGPANTATFGFINNIAVDSIGNVFVSENNYSVLRQVTPSGDVFTLAGSQQRGWDDGVGTDARFQTLNGVTTDANGNVYVTHQQQIRKVDREQKLYGDPSGQIGVHPVVLNVSDQLGGSVDQSFSITVSDASPKLTDLTPSNGTEATDTTLFFSMKFNENVAKGPGSVYLITTADSSLFASVPPSALTVEQDSIYATIDNLAVSTQYSLIVTDSTIQDLDGNPFDGLAAKNLWSFTTADFPLSILSTYPSHEQTNIPFDTTLMILFDRNIMAGSGSIHLIQTTDSSLVQSFDVLTELAINGDTAFFSPSFLANDTQYSIIIPVGSIEDVSGNSFEGIVDKMSWSFRTGAFLPLVNFKYPVANNLNQALDHDFRMTFSEYVVPNAGSIYLIEAIDSSLVQSFDINTHVVFDNDRITFTPNLLRKNTAYALIVPDSVIQDLSGNHIQGFHNIADWTFTTRDFSLAVSNTYPVDNQLNVPLDSVFSIEFNQAVSPGTGSIHLIQASDSSLVQSFDVSVDLTFQQNIVSFTPNTLQEGISYAMIIPSGAIQDLEGGDFVGIQNKTIWNFTSFDPTIDPTILKIDSDPVVHDLDATFKIVVQVADPLIESITMTGPVNIVRYNSALNPLILIDDGTQGDEVGGDMIFTVDGLSIAGVVGNPLVNTAGGRDIHLRLHYPNGQFIDVDIDPKLAIRGVSLSQVPTPAVMPLAADAQMTDYVLNLVVTPSGDFPEYVFDKREAAKKYYEYFPDDRDFLLFATTYPEFGLGAANYYSVSNDIQGIGLGIFDNSADYGSGGRLQGRLDFKLWHGASFSLVKHELLHRWGAYLPLSLGLNDHKGHWLPVDNMPATGFGSTTMAKSIEPQGGNVYLVRTEPSGVYNVLEQYLMGLATIDEIPFPLRVLDNPQLLSFDSEGRYYQADGINEISQTDFVNAVGTRSPAVGQTDFNLGMIVLSEQLLTAEEMAYYHYWMVENELPTPSSSSGRMSATSSIYGENFQEATSGKAQLHTILSLSGPLPITLLSFDAIAYQNTVELFWQTASEVNNDYFEVFRSLNGKDWESINRVDGAGNSSEVLSYSTVDHEPYDGISYYRFQQVDFDGGFEYSPMRVVEVRGWKDQELLLYPNPTSDILNISGVVGSYRIYDMLGKVAMEGEGFPINTSELKDGIYMLVSQTQNARFIKMRTTNR